MRNIGGARSGCSRAAAPAQPIPTKQLGKRPAAAPATCEPAMKRPATRQSGEPGGTHAAPMICAGARPARYQASLAAPHLHRIARPGCPFIDETNNAPRARARKMGIKAKRDNRMASKVPFIQPAPVPVPSMAQVLPRPNLPAHHSELLDGAVEWVIFPQRAEKAQNDRIVESRAKEMAGVSPATVQHHAAPKLPTKLRFHMDVDAKHFDGPEEHAVHFAQLKIHVLGKEVAFAHWGLHSILRRLPGELSHMHART
jgi:hypothetical protein